MPSLWRLARPRPARAVALTAVGAGAAGLCALWRAWHRHHAALALDEPVVWSPGAGEISSGSLSARRIGSAGRPVVLLHGLGGSRSVWGAAYDQLAADHRVVALDLLGCGQSPHPTTGYTLDDHADAVNRTLEELDAAEGAIVVGHSFGSLVALALALRHPAAVGGIIAISPPLYRSPREAAERTAAALTPLERFLCLPSRWSRLLCRNVCMRRPRLAEAAARRLRRELPAVVVNESIMHTWDSYSQSIAELLGARARPEWLGRIVVPVRIILGSRDRMPDVELLREIAAGHPRVRLSLLDGANHLIPLTHAADCVAAVRELAAALP